MQLDRIFQDIKYIKIHAIHEMCVQITDDISTVFFLSANPRKHIFKYIKLEEKNTFKLGENSIISLHNKPFK